MTILIVGAGHAGGAIAANLRQLGSEEPIVVVGDEHHLPYQRPPLSKAWLKNDLEFAAVGLRPGLRATILPSIECANIS